MVDGYQLIANAVVAQAAKDYRQALVDQHNRPSKKTDKEVAKLERFFTGNTIRLYTKLDGTALMQAIKAEVIEFNYDLKALEESHFVAE